MTPKWFYLFVVTCMALLVVGCDDDSDEDTDEESDDSADQNAGCAKDCHGDKDSPLPTDGVHEAHGEVGCEECHEVPASGDTSHVDGEAAVVFGSLAKTGGLKPEFDAKALTCADTYCHGASLTDGSNTTPAWDDDTQMKCGSCHGYPPTTDHVDNDSCEKCHSSVWDGTDFVDPSLHRNGSVDL
jgi:predicted CxxxxCH...CXXCH cytochrome family protein